MGLSRKSKKPKRERANKSKTGKVVGVVDGDTIKVRDVNGRIRKIRIADVNTPEKGKPGYQKAKQNTTRALLGKKVVLKLRPSLSFDREVAHVHVKTKTGQKSFGKKLRKKGFRYKWS